MPNVTENVISLPDVLSEAQQWFSFLSDFRLNCIEGNHRLEFYSRIALGYNIYQAAPLEKLTSPRLFNKYSTVYRAISLQFYYQTNCYWQNDSFLKAMKAHSNDIQTKKIVYLPSTWSNVMSVIAEKIYERTSGGEDSNYTIDPFEILVTMDKDPKKLRKDNTENLEKLIKIQISLIKIMNEVLFTLEPAKTEMKEMTKDKAAFDNALEIKQKGVTGISSCVFPNVSFCLRFDSFLKFKSLTK